MKFRLYLISLISFFSFLLGRGEEMPVLKVYFPGDHLIYEDYTFGRMELTDTDGKVVELPARFKTRGATARSYPMKPSFNMKLETEEGEEIDYNILDLRKASSFILDAMAIDRICMRNRVCFDIWNQYSRLPYKTDFDSRNGTVGKFVIVYMNDEYKGIYCLTDKINRKLLDLKKPKIDNTGEVVIRGVLYKQGATNVKDKSVPGYYNDFMDYVPIPNDSWELKEPDAYPSEEAWQPLADYYKHYGIYSNIKEDFYIENLNDFTLLVMAMAAYDNWWTKNKYFSMRDSREKGEDIFIVTPWDLDASLGGGWDGEKYDGDYIDWTPEEMASQAVSPFSICLRDPQARELLKARWIETRETVFSVENVASLMYGYCDLFESSGAWQEQVEYWDAHDERPKYVNDLRKEIDLIMEWYADRVEEIDNYFEIDDSGVYSPSSETQGKDDNIYNLQGCKVSEDRLLPGQIYIRNGKKFIAR